MWVRLWNRLTFLFRRGRFDRELTEELDFHRQMLEADKFHDEHDHEAAARAAGRQLGNTILAREDAAGPWMFGRTAAMLTDLRDAVRSLRVGRRTSLLAFGILTVAIAASTVTYSVVYPVALRPLPFGSPGGS